MATQRGNQHRAMSRLPRFLFDCFTNRANLPIIASLSEPLLLDSAWEARQVCNHWLPKRAEPTLFLTVAKSTETCFVEKKQDNGEQLSY